MKKTIFILLIAAIFTTSAMSPVSAKKSNKVETPPQEIIFEGTVVIDNTMTKFEIGFVTVTFKKNFVEEDLYPLSFDIKIYAEDGLVYIEFDPDMDYFLKSVQVHVSSYEGLMYDVAIDDYIFVDIPTQNFKVDHFSRYCFAW